MAEVVSDFRAVSVLDDLYTNKLLSPGYHQPSLQRLLKQQTPFYYIKKRILKKTAKDQAKIEDYQEHLIDSTIAKTSRDLKEDDEFGPLDDVDECNIDEDGDALNKQKGYEELYKDRDAFLRIQELRILDKQLEHVDLSLNF